MEENEEEREGGERWIREKENDEEDQWDVGVARDIVEDLEEEEQSQLEAQLKEAYGQVQM